MADKRHYILCLENQSKQTNQEYRYIRMIRVVAILLSVILAVVLQQVTSHGYMDEPPNRASMWRKGYNTPINYNDNQYFCGGFQVRIRV
jgi:predicted carbohydrate-binding protein with CBM5 and CBM33 domain